MGWIGAAAAGRRCPDSGLGPCVAAEDGTPEAAAAAASVCAMCGLASGPASELASRSTCGVWEGGGAGRRFGFAAFLRPGAAWAASGCLSRLAVNLAARSCVAEASAATAARKSRFFLSSASRIAASRWVASWRASLSKKLGAGEAWLPGEAAHASACIVGRALGTPLAGPGSLRDCPAGMAFSTGALPTRRESCCCASLW